MVEIVLKYRFYLLIINYFFISLLSTFCQSYYENSNLYFPRLEASPQSRALVNYIKEQLDKWELPYQQYDFAETTSQHSFSTCLEVTVKGEKPDTLLICAPLHHPLDATSADNGYLNIHLAFQILSSAKQKRLPVSLKVLFLGAEFGEAEETNYPLGSRFFLENFYPEEPVNVLYLNFRRIPQTVNVHCGARGIVSPSWYVLRCVSALKEAGLKFYVKGDELQLFRANLLTQTTQIDPYLRAGYPAISFEGEYKALTRADEELWLSNFDKFFWSFVESYRAGTLDTWDNHYLLFQLARVFFIIPEQAYLILCLLIFSLLILYIQLNTQLFLHYIKIIFKNTWILLTMFILLFFLFFVTTWIVKAILWARDNDLIWQIWPLLFFSLKFIFTLLLFFLIYKEFHHLSLPHSPRFYCLAALFFVGLNTVILALINLSLSFYFLWAFCCLFFVFVLPYRFIKIILISLSLFFITKAVFDFFTLPELDFVRLFLLSPVNGNVLLTFFVFPYVLLSIYLSSYFKLPQNLIVRISRISFVSLGLLIAGLLAFAGFVSPFTEQTPQPVNVTDNIDLDLRTNTLQIASEAVLGRMEYWDGHQLLYFAPRAKQFTLPLNEVQELVTTEVKSASFLGRENFSITLKPEGRPYKINFLLKGKEEFILFDANYPFIKDVSGRRYTITVGKHPPNPFTLELTLLQGLNLDLEVSLTYLEFPFPFNVTGKDMKVRNFLTVKKTLQLGT